MCYQDFAYFLARELMPQVREHYNATADTQNVIVAGSSLGGLAALHAVYQHPDVFGNDMSQSGSYWYTPNEGGEPNWLAQQFSKRETLPLNIFMEVGTYETPAEMLKTNRDLRDVLEAKGYLVEYREFIGGHDYAYWRGSMADGLIALIGKE